MSGVTDLIFAVKDAEKFGERMIVIRELVTDCKYYQRKYSVIQTELEILDLKPDVKKRLEAERKYWLIKIRYSSEMVNYLSRISDQKPSLDTLLEAERDLLLAADKSMGLKREMVEKK